MKKYEYIIFSTKDATLNFNMLLINLRG